MTSKISLPLSLCLVAILLGACGDGRDHPLPREGELHIRIADDPAWIDRHCKEAEADCLEVYDVTVPAEGALTVRLIDRETSLVELAADVDSGTARVAVWYQIIPGGTVLEGEIYHLLRPEERERLLEIGPDLEKRSVMRLNLLIDRIRTEKIPPTGTRTKTSVGAERLSGPHDFEDDPDPVVHMSASFPNGLRKGKPGEPLVIHTWLWKGGDFQLFSDVVVGEDKSLLGIGTEGEKIPLSGRSSPVWALVLEFNSS